VVEWGGGCRIDAAGSVGRRLGVGTCSKGGEGGGGDQWRSRWVAIVAIAGDRGRQRGSRDGGGRGRADVATGVVDVDDEGGGDVATGVVDVDDEGGRRC
jgi:hypothetical protein